MKSRLVRKTKPTAQQQPLKSKPISASQQSDSSKKQFVPAPSKHLLTKQMSQSSLNRKTPNPKQRPALFKVASMSLLATTNMKETQSTLFKVEKKTLKPIPEKATGKSIYSIQGPTQLKPGSQLSASGSYKLMKRSPSNLSASSANSGKSRFSSQGSSAAQSLGGTGSSLGRNPYAKLGKTQAQMKAELALAKKAVKK